MDGRQEASQTTTRRVRLRSGDSVDIRPLRLHDAPALAAAVEQLSEPSRLRRFHALSPGLTAPMLEYLTDIDHNDHEALVALAPRSREIIGLARFVRDTATPDTAELAITVADAWQRRGLARVLLDELAKRATQVGIDRFTAEILADNAPTLALLHHLGTPDLTHHGSTITASMDHRDWTSTPVIPSSRSRFRLRGRRRGN